MTTEVLADELSASQAARACLAALRGLVGSPDGPIERHSVRVFLLAKELARRGPDAIDPEVLLCAAILHDAGLYPGAATKAAYVTDGRRVAERLLAAEGWPDERVRLSADAVEHHHQLVTQWHRGVEVELLRRADLIEVSHGLVRFGLERAWLAQLRRNVRPDGFVGEVARQLAVAARRRPATLWRIVRPPSGLGN